MSDKRQTVYLGELGRAVPENANLSKDVRRLIESKYVRDEVIRVAEHNTTVMEDELAELRASLQRINEASADAIENIKAVQEVLDETTDTATAERDTDLELRDIADLDRQWRTPENPRVCDVAESLGITPDDVIKRLEEQYPTDSVGNSPYNRVFSDENAEPA